MDFGNVQQEINNTFLVVVAILTSTFQPPASPKIISPLPTEVSTPTIQVVDQPFYSSPSAVLSKKEVSTISAKLKTNRNISSSSSAVVGNQTAIPPTVVPTKHIVTPTPTATPLPTSTPLPTPTQTPVPTATTAKEIELHIPTPAQSSTKQSLNSDEILRLINDHRKSIGAAPFAKDEKLCELARYRGPQLEEEIFTTGAVHQGLYDLKLPYIIVENMASYSSEQQIFNWWMNSWIHKASIEGDYTYSCGVCSGNSCAQLFTNYTPR